MGKENERGEHGVCCIFAVTTEIVTRREKRKEEKKGN